MIYNINVKNKQINQIYKETQSMDLDAGQTLRDRGFVDYDSCVEHACSEEYLANKLHNNDIGFHIEHSSNILIGETPGGEYLLNKFKDILHYDQYYTSGYVPRGFVGWHSDEDISGWYLMITYSPAGAGFFRYRNNITGKIVTLPDTPGWMTRAVELPSDRDRVFWHCAAADNNRYTFLLLYKNYNAFESAVNMLGVE